MTAITSNHSTELTDLVDKYADLLFRFAVSRLHDESTAEDLVQETFLAALQAYTKFTGSSSVEAWLIGILKHKLIDHYRHARWFVDMDKEYKDDMFDETGHWLESTAPVAWSGLTPESILEQREIGRVLKECLISIPSQLATVFILREIDGMTRNEICEILGISAANYWVMLHRARLQLRREFERRWQTVSSVTAQNIHSSSECLQAT